MVSTQTNKILSILEKVKDPEIPVLSIVDMGMVNGVEEREGMVTVLLTPTFTGCPALDFIAKEAETRLRENGFPSARVEWDLSIPWDSSRISDKGRELLDAFGLGYPSKIFQDPVKELEKAVCPHCGSKQTSLRSPFGSTLCRSIHLCENCGQTFEKFKPL